MSDEDLYSVNKILLRVVLTTFDGGSLSQHFCFFWEDCQGSKSTAISFVVVVDPIVF